MGNKLNEKLKKIYTGHVYADASRCKACWDCLSACPSQVIGKVSFLWHKHIVLRKSDNCTGCKKCVKACQHGVFSEDLPDAFRGITQCLGITGQ